MSRSIIPTRLQKGDTIAVVTPSLARRMVPRATLFKAQQRLESLGLKVLWAPGTARNYSGDSSPASVRAGDLAWAFGNRAVKAIWCAVGGFNANQLLEELDWRVVRDNPKLFIGHSDSTILNNAIYARTGLVTYYGPNLYSLASATADYTGECIAGTLMSPGDFVIPWAKELAEWTSGWRAEKRRRPTTLDKGVILAPGRASGIGIGGNVGTFFLIQGTAYMPRFDRPTILCLEDDDLPGKFTLAEFDRKLTSILQQPGAEQHVAGLIIGRFQAASKARLIELRRLIATQPKLRGKPVVAGIPFGHTEPKCLLPIGGTITLDARGPQPQIIVAGTTTTKV